MRQFRRNGSLRRPSCTTLFPFLQKLQYEQSHRLIKLQAGVFPRRPNKIYVKLNERLKKQWTEFEVSIRRRADGLRLIHIFQEKKAEALREIDLLKISCKFLAKANHVLSDVDDTGNRTVKAGKAAANKKKILSPKKKKKKKSPKIKKHSPVPAKRRRASTPQATPSQEPTGDEDEVLCDTPKIPTRKRPREPTEEEIEDIRGDGNCGVR
jgi:hypothetical protein